VDGFLVETGDVQAAARYAVEILSRADPAAKMGKIARINAKKNYCPTTSSPPTSATTKRVLDES